jgi:LysR family transcriptional regulator, nod-box dependent transcriptional activator
MPYHGAGMRFHQLDLNLLVALDALLTERSITLAGQKLHMSQSGMSSGLARLREYFGDDLLVLIGKKMVPTPLGESLAEPVRRILLDIQSTLDAQPGFNPATSSRRFTLMMSDYVATVLMTELTRRVARLAPGVCFELLSNNAQSPVEFLDRGEVDILIMPEDVTPGSHPKARLYEDSYVCLVSSDNAEVAGTLSLDQYLSLGHVVLQFSRGRVPAIDEWFLTQAGHVRRIEIIAMNFNMLPQFIVGTGRIATVQRRLAQYYVKIMPLRIIEPPLALPTLIESAHWNAAFDRDPGNLWLRQVLKEAAQGVAS